MTTWIVGQLLVGWLLADLVTGVFHWWEDRFGNESWPIIGPWIVAPNRLHHADPLAFTRNGFLGRNLASIVTAAVVWLAWCAAFAPSLAIATMCVGGALTNEVHRFAHQPSAAPAWLRVAQQIGILQSPKVHAAHHRPPHLANFCVLTDWLNPVLEALGFWAGLERLFRRNA